MKSLIRATLLAGQTGILRLCGPRYLTRRLLIGAGINLLGLGVLVFHAFGQLHQLLA